MNRSSLNSSKAEARPLGPVLAPTPPALSTEDIEELKSHAATIEYRCDPLGGPDGTILTGPPAHDGSCAVLNLALDVDGAAESVMVCTTLPRGTGPDEPVSECFFYTGSKSLLMSTFPEFPQPLVQPATPAFRVGPAPGKGLGLFAARALKAGDLIVSERPLFVAANPTKLFCAPHFTPAQQAQHAKNERERHYALCVARMRPDCRAALMALANSHTDDGFGLVDGILATNGMGIYGLRPGDDGVCTAVCNNISRANHSCSPNATLQFYMPSFSYRLFAVRDIAAGEELTVTYTYLDCPAAERHAKLKNFRFTCTCASCTDVAASDARRARLLPDDTQSPFHAHMALWMRNHYLPRDWLLRVARVQLALLEREGLEHLPLHAAALRALVEAYIRLGDAQRASKWAARLNRIVWDDTYADPADPGVKALLDPASAAYQAHPIWRTRADGATD